ncbi:MAG: preprotein translocase subunit SecA [Gammaproteobacteria bacterium]
MSNLLDILPRPGIRLGNYPQRQSRDDGLTDRLMSPILKRHNRLTYGRKKPWRDMLKTVNAAARGFAGLQDEQLQQLISNQREALYRQGLEPTLIAVAFALIREVAWRSLGKRHYDEQLIGGWLLVNGQLAEMETGEGKTLTATLPAATAALAGIPVHVITVNDYLAARDAEVMSPVYEMLGLSVGVITGDMELPARKQAYSCNITYCSNKQLVFDYLRDRVAMDGQQSTLTQRVTTLKNAASEDDAVMLRGLCFGIVDEADSVLIDEAKTPLILSRPGDNRLQTSLCRIALKLAQRLEKNLDFRLTASTRKVELTDRGLRKLAEAGKRLGSPWNARRRREEWVSQAIAAVHFYHRDREYLVRDGKVQIIDEATGRILADRSWEQGLHQMIESKEGCDISAQNETLARISYQQFFQRYLHLSGMSGTAKEVSDELWSVYRLPVIAVPTHRVSALQKQGDEIYRNAEQKWQAVVASIREIHALGRPQLVGTRSVQASEMLSTLLQKEKLPHQVLNARQDTQEAAIIAQAGQPGQITVATNMAGRGTDISLSEEAEAAGGLHVIATEKHDSSRIDRQLFGRCARQGAVGSCQAILSLQDELITKYLSPFMQQILLRLPVYLRLLAVRSAQKTASRRHRALRQQLLKHNDYLKDFLAFTGAIE